MALPKVNNPTFTLDLPVSKKKVEFRPFLVKEEKMLLVAMESDETQDTINTIRNVLNNCIVTEEFYVNKLPSFEIEYLFLNIRAKSVGEVIDLKLKHPDDINKSGDECKHIQDVQVNIDDIKLQIPDEHTNTIMLTDTLGVVMSYPSLEFADRMTGISQENTEDIFNIVCQSIDKIFDEDQVYETKEHTEKEINEFVESLNHKQFEKISGFFETMPKLKHNIEYTCEGCGEKQNYEVEGLENFF